MPFEVWCANIAPKFVPFWGNSSAKTQQFYL
jgi:hypothetical protein